MMIDGHCKDCKWWVKAHEFSRYAGKTCESPKVHLGYHANQAEIAPDEIIVECDACWGWIVGPEFGCVHFEKK